MTDETSVFVDGFRWEISQCLNEEDFVTVLLTFSDCAYSTKKELWTVERAWSMGAMGLDPTRESFQGRRRFVRDTEKRIVFVLVCTGERIKEEDWWGKFTKKKYCTKAPFRQGFLTSL